MLKLICQMARNAEGKREAKYTVEHQIEGPTSDILTEWAVVTVHMIEAIGKKVHKGPLLVYREALKALQARMADRIAANSRSKETTKG